MLPPEGSNEILPRRSRRGCIKGTSRDRAEWGGVEGQAGRGGVGLRRGADGGGRKEGREGNVD